MKTLFYAFCWLIARALPQKEGAIALMYHSVGENASRLTVSPREFRRQMEFLKHHRTVISMKELLLFREGREDILKNAVMVTIDDGYKDTYTNAFPILKEFGIPFTLFLTSDLSQMDVLGNIPRLTWDELREMMKSGLMEVGLHGHRHVKVGTLVGNMEKLDEEFKLSMDIIERELAVRPRVYAYAFGRRHEDIPPYVKTLGITALFGITDGTITKESPLSALRRVQIDNTMSSSLFRLRTTPAVDVAFRVRRFLGR